MLNVLRIFVVFVLLFVVLIGGAVFAQDEVANNDEVGTLVSDVVAPGGFSFEIPATSYDNRLQVFAELFFKLIYNLAYLPVAAPLVHILVQLSKRFVSDKISAPLLNFLFTVLLFAVWIISNEIGYGGQFESVLAGLTTMGVGILGVTLSTSASSQLFQFSKGQKLPLLGYSRTA